MIMKQQKRLAMVTGILLVAVSLDGLASTDRWYTNSQVQQGESLFKQNCASCHGQNAEATPNWQKTLPNGKYPAPPLNGTAHAWHHPKNILERQIKQGGEKLGGWMPGFNGKLSDHEIDSILAYIQSKWTDDIYAKWSGRNQSQGFTAVSADTSNTPVVDTSLLSKRLNGAKVGTPARTTIDDVYQVQVGNGYVYLTGDGRYVFTGQLIDLKTGNNYTQTAINKSTLALVDTFSEENMVIYPAEGEKKSAITIFTDTTCPYCRKLHAEIPELLKAGVSVRYIAYPRGGKDGGGYETMKSVWCAEDKRQAMSIAKGTELGDLPAGDCKSATAVDEGYQLGNQVGLKGTPLIILPDGNRVDGYLPAKQILKRLGIQ